MLVAPDHDVEELGQEVLGDVVGGAALGAVLVQHEYVEPGASVLRRPLECHLRLEISNENMIIN